MSPQATCCKVGDSETGRRSAGTFTVCKPRYGEHCGPLGFRCLAVDVVAGKRLCLICKPLPEASCT